MSSKHVESRLAALGIVLPQPKPPVANYLGCKQSGDLLFVSGLVSELRGQVGGQVGSQVGGQVGAEVSRDQAKDAARQTVITMLAIVRRDFGDLDRIAAVERLQGFVRSAADFTEQPEVINGASDLLVALFGEAGRHARTATGVMQLPFGAAVQLDMTLRLHPA